MIVDTTAGRIVNAACAHAVASASTGTTAQMLGSQIAPTSPMPNNATSRPTNAIAAGGLRRNSASARRPETAMASRVGIAMIVAITPRWNASRPSSSSKYRLRNRGAVKRAKPSAAIPTRK